MPMPMPGMSPMGGGPPQGQSGPFTDFMQQRQGGGAPMPGMPSQPSVPSSGMFSGDNQSPFMQMMMMLLQMKLQQMMPPGAPGMMPPGGQPPMAAMGGQPPMGGGMPMGGPPQMPQGPMGGLPTTGDVPVPPGANLPQMPPRY